MEKVIVKIKKVHPNAKIPSIATDGSAAFDLYCTKISKNTQMGNLYFLGIQMEIPEDYCLLLFPKSRNTKTTLYSPTAVSIIDSDYRGEIIFPYRDAFDADNNGEFTISNYEVGDAVCQGLIIPKYKVDFIETDELSKTKRGNGGFGSTKAKGH